MDELLNDFLIETNEHIEAAGELLVAFEREPSNKATIAKIFRLVHTIKGTCGFLGLSRLEHLAHVSEALIGRLRDGAAATPETVSAILASIDRVKFILGALEKTRQGAGRRRSRSDRCHAAADRDSAFRRSDGCGGRAGAGRKQDSRARCGRPQSGRGPRRSGHCPTRRTGLKQFASRSALSSGSCCSSRNWF